MRDLVGAGGLMAGPGKTLLVVEDDPDIVYALAAFLETEGYTVRSGMNGLEALDILGLHGMPNLILLDMKMPVMDGWKFSEEFRARYGNRVPIVVMTAAGDPAKRAREIDAAGWVGKPFDVEHLLSVVRSLEL